MADAFGGSKNDASLGRARLTILSFPPPIQLPTPCDLTSTGDAGTILRVHEFLDRWGLINAEVKCAD